RSVEGFPARLSGRCMLMSPRARLVVFAACVAAVGGVLLATPTPAGAGGSGDGGQVIVTPTDPYGRYSQPGVDMSALLARGEGPVRDRGPPAAAPTTGPQPPPGAGSDREPPRSLL